MKNIDSISHVSGTSNYVDDIPEISGTVHAVPVFSSLAHAEIIGIDLKEAQNSPGVISIFTANDIPNENQIGSIFNDETLFAENEVHYVGQPVALVVADSHFNAIEARKKVEIRYKEKEIITDPREANEKGLYLFKPRVFKSGNIEKGFAECEYIFEGQTESGGQEHLYIETQGAYAIPLEKNKLKIISSTQGPTAVQMTVSRVLGISMNSIEVDVTRLGGGFGGKEDQATPWAVMAALSSYKLNKPTKLILDRSDDIRVTGKRHPYSSDFKIGLDKNLKIISYEVKFFQNGGAAADLSSAILERTLFHTTNSYYIPNVQATGISCKTHLPPFTAFRGFGGPQAMFVIESAIAKAANELNIDKSEIQKANLINSENSFYYGQLCKSKNAVDSWITLEKTFNVNSEIEKIAKFNSENEFIKKGHALMPICFGISFTKMKLNQARVLVHLYQDGSINISTGAVEMGQGVNTKMHQVASQSFGISGSKINIESTSTSRVANMSPTAASSASDLNGKALQIACDKIKNRLLKKAAEILNVNIGEVAIGENILIKGKPSDLSWDQLILQAYEDRIQLSELGHYSTPNIYFDTEIEQGHPFAYHVFGVASTTINLDCITGLYEIEKVNIVHDFGNSMNLPIDMGQVEGALLQGIGWMTIEELGYNKEGVLLSDSLSKYKIPDIFMSPSDLKVTALETEGPALAILKSKAVGEPPFMYGIGTYFALQDAIKAFNKSYHLEFDAPMTPEKALLALYTNE